MPHTVKPVAGREAEHPLRLHSCVASRGLSRSVAAQSTEVVLPYHVTRLALHCSLRRAKPSVEILMMAFCVIVSDVALLSQTHGDTETTPHTRCVR